MNEASKVECQVCGGCFKATKGGMVGKHGYKRPGDGFLHGECRGAGRAPYKATDAIVETLAVYAPAAAAAEALSARYAAREVTAFVVRYSDGTADHVAVGVTTPKATTAGIEALYGRKAGEVAAEAAALRGFVSYLEGRLAAAK